VTLLHLEYILQDLVISPRENNPLKIRHPLRRARVINHARTPTPWVHDQSRQTVDDDDDSKLVWPTWAVGALFRGVQSVGGNIEDRLIYKQYTRRNVFIT
jgi:hypothetical protein